MNAAEWTNLPDLDPAKRQRLVDELLRTGSDVSVFELIDEDDGDRIAVALASLRRPGHFDSIEISGSDLLAIGLSCRETPGGTGVPEVDRLHRVIDLDPDSARRLILRLVDSGATRVRTRERALRERARQLRDAGRITIPSDSWLLNQPQR